MARPSVVAALGLALLATATDAKQLLGLERCEGGEFYESGPLKDEEVSLGAGDGGRRVSLSTPIRLKGRSYRSVYLSPKGVIGLSYNFGGSTRRGWEAPWNEAFVAPFWSDDVHYRHGSIFYRETTHRLYLDRADRQLDYQGFKYRGDERIKTRSIFIVTFLDLKEDPWRTQEGHSFQVSFYSTNAGTFVNLIYGNVDEYGLRDQLAAIGAGDGAQFYRFPFSGTEAKLLVLLGNTSTKGNWLLRIDERSGTSACLPHSRRVNVCSTRHSFTHDSYCEPRRMAQLPFGAQECQRRCKEVLSCPEQRIRTTWVPRWKRARNVRRQEPSRSGSSWAGSQSHSQPQPQPQPWRSSWRSNSRTNSGSNWRSSWSG